MDFGPEEARTVVGVFAFTFFPFSSPLTLDVCINPHNLRPYLGDFGLKTSAALIFLFGHQTPNKTVDTI